MTIAVLLGGAQWVSGHHSDGGNQRMRRVTRGPLIHGVVGVKLALRTVWADGGCDAACSQGGQLRAPPAELIDAAALVDGGAGRAWLSLLLGEAHHYDPGLAGEW
ncbi:hypothetical protein [Streptomyces sp. NPDC001480]|uniref:hypothetical protein n=1 Tax=Streptomyces sp. NPDC001480 TaxID=3364577 RepID=UPI003692E172